MHETSSLAKARYPRRSFSKHLSISSFCRDDRTMLLLKALGVVVDVSQEANRSAVSQDARHRVAVQLRRKPSGCLREKIRLQKKVAKPAIPVASASFILAQSPQRVAPVESLRFALRRASPLRLHIKSIYENYTSFLHLFYFPIIPFQHRKKTQDCCVQQCGMHTPTRPIKKRLQNSQLHKCQA